MKPQGRLGGTLYVVATPIGNLDDLSVRAADVLRAAPVHAAEDTRRLRILAERHGFRPRVVVRCDEHAEARAIPQLLRALEAGDDVALTSDAGTPGVADPGARVVRAVAERSFTIVPIPGPSAPVAALSASGVDGERFLFAGFPPRRPGELGVFLDDVLARRETLVLLENPERLPRLLAALAQRAPERRTVVARELTKVHESLSRGTAAELSAALEAVGGVRGEVVVIVEGSRARPDVTAGEARARDLLGRPWAAKLTRRDLADLLAAACDLDRNAAYRLAGAPPGGGAAEDAP